MTHIFAPALRDILSADIINGIDKAIEDNIASTPISHHFRTEISQFKQDLYNKMKDVILKATLDQSTTAIVLPDYPAIEIFEDTATTDQE